MQPEIVIIRISLIIVKETSVYWHKAAIARDFIREKVCSTTTIDPVTLIERPPQLANGAVLGIWKRDISYTWTKSSSQENNVRFKMELVGKQHK